MAASMWKHMPLDERWAYEEQARNKKQNLCHADFENKFRPRRRYCAQIEWVLNRAKGQIRMTLEIKETMHMLKNQNSLKTHLFHLVHVNYYCKHRSGRNLGCEIPLAEFSFTNGFRKPCHALINPSQISLVHAFLATKHATGTHLVPLYPDVCGGGGELDHLEIHSNTRLFLM